MRAVLLEVDERMLAERRRLGLDHSDEMWEGVLHVVPPASNRHQRIETQLALALEPSARSLGWRVQAETGVFASDDDYRVPDVIVFSDDVASDRGVEEAPELVIEIHSPGDETNQKIPWYLERGARAVLVVDRDPLALELWDTSGRVRSDADGAVQLEALGLRIAPTGDTLDVGGHRLRL